MKRYLTVFVLAVLTMTVFAPAASASGPVRNFIANHRPGLVIPRAQACPCGPACDCSAGYGCGCRGSGVVRVRAGGFLERLVDAFLRIWPVISPWIPKPTVAVAVQQPWGCYPPQGTYYVLPSTGGCPSGQCPLPGRR